MNKLTKNKKKKGFTLIELIAVIAIIGILAAVLVPKVVGYMNDARDSKVLAQARNVVMAAGTMSAKDEAIVFVTDTTTVQDVYDKYMENTTKWADYVEVTANSVDKLKGDATLAELKAATDAADAASIKGTGVTPVAP